MRRHGEVSAGEGRRGRQVSSPTDGSEPDASGSSGLPSPNLKPDNVFSLFPPEPHHQSQFSPPRMPPDALVSVGKPRTPLVAPEKRSANRTGSHADDHPDSVGDQDRKTHTNSPVENSVDQQSDRPPEMAENQSQESRVGREPGDASRHMNTSVSQQAVPSMPQQPLQQPSAPSPANELPAWTQHPITKALDALHGSSGVPSPTQIIAESLRGLHEGWMPIRPLPPEAPQPYQPTQPEVPEQGEIPVQSDGQAREVPVQEELGEEAAIAAEAKLAAEQQFWELWLTHQDQLRKQCMHMMSGNLADAEDALSSAMLRASQKFVEYSGSIMNEKAWLSKLVHNVCIDQYRQRKRTYYQALEGDATEQVEEAMFSGPQPSPEEVALGREQVATLEACLEKLSSNLRVPLMLRCVEGWSYPDIAAELDLRADTVRKRVQLARDFLRGRDIR